MATHSSILARRIPWTKEPVGYSSWGHKRVGYNLVNQHTQSTPKVVSELLTHTAVKNTSQVALVVKNPLGRYPGGVPANPLQSSFLESPTDRGAQQAAVHRVAESQTRLEQLSTCTQGTNTRNTVFACILFTFRCLPDGSKSEPLFSQGTQVGSFLLCSLQWGHIIHLYHGQVHLQHPTSYSNRLVPNRKRSTSRLYIVTLLI